MRAVSPTGALFRSLGWWGGVRVGLRLALGGGGAPFEHLDPPEDERERLSRGQAVLAIRLYRVLLERYSPERALVVAGHVIEAGAVEHLGKTLGALNAQSFKALDEEARLSKVRGWISSFFTATARIDQVSSSQVSFTVTACALARLCREAGHPELSPAFCRGDALFFCQPDAPDTPRTRSYDRRRCTRLPVRAQPASPNRAVRRPGLGLSGPQRTQGHPVKGGPVRK